MANPHTPTKWDLRFLRLAREIATWSKDPTTQVGCVITLDNVIIGTGYNGFPKGIFDEEMLLQDKDAKRLRMIHAEDNAAFYATRPLKGSTVYVTHHPCAACAARLIRGEPRMIIIPKSPSNPLSEDWSISLKAATEMFYNAGIFVGEVENV